MARNDHSEEGGAADLPDHALADDVKRLLDQLAGQIGEAEQRHAENRGEMQSRAANLADRAAAARQDVPEESAEAFGRVERAMADLAGRLTSPAQPPPAAGADREPSMTVLPDEVRADLRRAIAEGSRAQRPAAPVTAVHDDAASASPEPAAEHPDANAGEHACLEDRFAAIADRVEQSLARLDVQGAFETLGARFDQVEARFTAVLDRLPASHDQHKDTDGLHTIEKQIAALVAHLGRTETQLGRLETIESRITELRHGPSDEQLGQFARSLAPTDEQLSAVAMAAAERAVERIRGPVQGAAATPGADAPPAVDPRLAELTTILQQFITEQRSIEALSTEALDTLHQAMQHLIDRVEAIEAAQATGHDALIRAIQAAPGSLRGDGRHESLDFGFREQDLAPAPGGIGHHELPRLAVIGPQVPAPGNGSQGAPMPSAGASADDDNQRRASVFDELTEAPESTAAQHEPESKTSPGANPGHREAFIAMARRAAERAAHEPAPTLAPDVADAAGPLAWVRRLTGRRAEGNAVGGSQRSRMLLVASFAAFLLAGYWLLAGTSLRGLIPGQPAAPSKSTGTRDAAPSSEHRSRTATDSGDKAGRFLPAGRMPGTTDKFPGMGRVSDGIGITIHDGAAPMRPRAPIVPGETVETASTPTRGGAEPPRLTPAAQSDAPLRGAGAPPAPVEMPPAMIGPLSLRHAAANGDPAAQFEVGVRFAEGKGVPQDFGQAATWYQRAAAQGLANAQYRLGALYDHGRGVAADPARARVWYGRAAEQGNLRAMHNLAVFSAGRPGSTPDYPLAVQWFTEAANRGLTDSQYNLGILYESGLGVPASMVEAYKWYALAARSGDKDAISRRDAIRGRLDPASVSAADTLVIRWRPKPTDPAVNDVPAGWQSARQ